MDPYNSKDEEQISYELRGKTSRVARSQRERNQKSKVNAEKSIQRKPILISLRQSSLPYILARYLLESMSQPPMQCLSA